MVHRLLSLTLLSTLSAAGFAEPANLSQNSLSINERMIAAGVEATLALKFLANSAPELKGEARKNEIRSLQLETEIKDISSKLSPAENPEVADIETQILNLRMTLAEAQGSARGWEVKKDDEQFRGGNYQSAAQAEAKITEVEAKLVVLQERLNKIAANPKAGLAAEEREILVARQIKLLSENDALQDGLAKARSTAHVRWWRFGVGAFLLFDVARATYNYTSYENGDFNLILLDPALSAAELAKRKIQGN